MFGVEANQLKPIHSVVKQLDPKCNPEKIGAWGICFFAVEPWPSEMKYGAKKLRTAILLCALPI